MFSIDKTNQETLESKIKILKLKPKDLANHNTNIEMVRYKLMDEGSGQNRLLLEKRL